MEPRLDNTADPAAAADADAACSHRWMLADTTKGQSTQGTCRLCGAVRTFTNARRTWSRDRLFQPRSPKPPPE